MKAHKHIVSGHHVAVVSDLEKWIAAIGDIAEQIQEVRKGSFRAEYKLFIAQTRLLSLRKRIEERAAAPEMYALLNNILNDLETYGIISLNDNAANDIRMLLAKARGEDAK